MKRRDDIVTSTYEWRDGFLIDVVRKTDHRNNTPMFEAYLYHEGYGIKMHMFGLKQTDVDGMREFLHVVESNLLNDYYIEDYIEEYAPELEGVHDVLSDL